MSTPREEIEAQIASFAGKAFAGLDPTSYPYQVVRLTFLAGAASTIKRYMEAQDPTENPGAYPDAILALLQETHDQIKAINK